VRYLVWDDVNRHVAIGLKHRPKVISTLTLRFWVARFVNSDRRHRVQVGPRCAISSFGDVALADQPQHLFAQRDPILRTNVRRPVEDLVASRSQAQKVWTLGTKRNAPVNRWLTNADGHRDHVLHQLGLSCDHVAEETVELLLESQYRNLLRPVDIEFLNGLQQS
jgi:hypothetical protein